MRFGSVCSGIEAASVAWHPLGWRASFVSEIERFPCELLRQRWPDTPLHGDFTTIEADQYAAIDLLVGGTPCQDFSVAGLRAGMAGDRGNLTLQFLTLAGRLRPQWVIWENVPGVLSSNGGRDFGSFLGGLGELGYGWAYRTLDAQHFGVPQRRRRVFVVGYSGDWRRAAAVLFERHCLQGHSSPRRQAREGIAPTISARPTGGGGLGTDFDLDGGLVARSLNAHAHANRCDGETETFVAHYQDSEFGCKEYDTGAIRAGRIPEHSMVVTHALRAEGFDASEDGTGRGTLIIPILEAGARTGKSTDDIRAGSGIGDAGDPMFTLQGGKQHAIAFQTRGSNLDVGDISGTIGSNADRASGSAPMALAFSGKDHGADAGELAPTLRAMGHSGSHANAGGQIAVALRGREGGATAELSDLPSALRAGGGGGDKAHVLTGTVRRLTPRECERLQGFEDDYTLIQYRGKPAADGPRYKALGNSMAVPVMHWIGQRIERVQGFSP